MSGMTEHAKWQAGNREFWERAYDGPPDPPARRDGNTGAHARTLRPMPEGARAYRVTQDGQRIDAREIEWIDIPAWVLAEAQS